MYDDIIIRIFMSVDLDNDYKKCWLFFNLENSVADSVASHNRSI